MESGWLVISTLRSSDGSDAGLPGRSYRISPIATPFSPATAGNVRPTTPQGRGTDIVRANSIVTARTYLKDGKSD
jgi:hypothetical protein